ncbi:MAG TPA: ribosomal protein S18-alanine N-acetyltransferase [Anaerolineae bacterium]|nr:ribosomal protein S18-alanine N-acetyltransferase [Anaerolineae bacterium]
MLKPPLPYLLREMRPSDITQVMGIEQVVFPTPWKASAYEYEVTRNRLAHYQVLLAQLGDQPGILIGYAGTWTLADELHISTIAVSKTWQGKGLGELLLLNMLTLAYQLPVTLVTLEVRRSNIVAQSLYKKYLFEIVGERRRYYESREDALIMNAGPLNAAYRVHLKECQKALFGRLQNEPPGGAGD